MSRSAGARADSLGLPHPVWRGPGHPQLNLRPCTLHDRPAYAAACSAQASCTLQVGGADRVHLRSVPTGVPHLRWVDAHHRLLHSLCRYPANTGAARGGGKATKHHPGTRALLWDTCDAQTGEGVEVEPDWDGVTQPAPDYETDQRVNW